MTGVEIGTLRLRGPPHLATRAAFRIEDGVRTELSDTRRLVLIRRMRPERRAVSERPEERSGAIRRAYAAATSDARHGRDAGDGAFNCVWFESPAEARRLLLAELLAGRRPGGWFWRLAVPEWRGRGLEEWLVEIVARALGGGDQRESLALVLLALESADIEIVVRAIQAAAGASWSTPAAALGPVHRDSKAVDQVRRHGGTEGVAALRQSVAELRARLPEPLCGRIEALARRLGPTRRPALALLERMLVQASPSLALAPEQIRQLALAWSERLAAPAPARPPSGITKALTAAPASSIDAEAPAFRKPTAEPRPPHREAPRPGASPRSAELPADVAETSARAETALTSTNGLASDAAGLWLVVPSLIHLGFREWLGERPHLLRQDAGRTLLRTIARHHRIADDDPAVAAFAALDGIAETPDWALCWRRGLDGWLRRRVRIPLHRLVWKRGDVTLAEEALTVRFPLEAADIRLRRRALDVDPGWVDWLGLCVRYRYEGKGR